MVVMAGGEYREMRRAKFCNELKKIVPKLKKEIEEKNTISMTPEKLRDMMELQYRSKHPMTIYWDTKYCLWNEGIIVESKKTDHKSIIEMRTRTPEDELPKELKT